jgi:hypothetical protein
MQLGKASNTGLALSILRSLSSKYLGRSIGRWNLHFVVDPCSLASKLAESRIIAKYHDDSEDIQASGKAMCF